MWPFDSPTQEIKEPNPRGGFNHAQVYQQIHGGPGPSGLSIAAGGWQQFAGRLADLQAKATNMLKQAGATWQGNAADMFQAGVSPMSDWLVEAQQATGHIGQQYETQADHFATVKNTMPPPVNVPNINQISNGNIITFLAYQKPIEQQEQAASQASDHAEAIYNSYTSNSTGTASNVKNRYSQPPAQVNLAPATVTPQVAPSAGLHTSSVPMTHASGTSAPQHTSAPTSTPGAPASVAPSQPPSSAPPIRSGTTAQQSTPTVTPPQTPVVGQGTTTGMPPAGTPGITADPVLGMSPGLGGGGSLGGGSGSGSGSDIARRMAGGEPEPAPGEGGGAGARSGSGLPGVGAAAEEAAAEELGTGGAGKSSMSGMPMSGGAGKKEEDAEHKRKYGEPTADHWGEKELPRTVNRTIGEREL
jgi:uncharacterized protein YukE